MKSDFRGALSSGLPHDDDHDPIQMHQECLVCNLLLWRAWQILQDDPDAMWTGPKEVNDLMVRIREVLA